MTPPASPELRAAAERVGPSSAGRVWVDAKFFRLGGGKFFVKGLTYGPFRPDEAGETFPSREQAARDFRQILELGANVLRVYYVPPAWFLDLAQEHGLKVLVDVPWAKHRCFLDSRKSQAEARAAVRQAVTVNCGHPAILAYSLVNEIPADVVRWSGVRRVEGFIEELVEVAKTVDPGALCTFASFPPTEFLHPQGLDFVCFNVYLHHRKRFEAYLARLQMLAGARPLLLGESGIDSIREGETHKCDILSWQIEAATRGGLAGIVLFSYSDDWWRGGHPIEDWAFGLTTRDRQPKDSFNAVRKQYAIAPRFPLPRVPRVSVVVATYNGSRTLPDCLESLQHLRYPDYEVIVVDDGSTDTVPQVAAGFPQVRYLRQSNGGLSAARNAGIAAATGEIVAFTDDDCRADEDWLYYLVGDLLQGGLAGIGGHNFLPPDDSRVAAAVLVSPGGPAHVMLNDRVAEHVPGCNMAFWKWALEEVGGFDPIFRKAGDDVDLCWRLQECGYQIGFSPAGFVWHYRRSTVHAYLKQQAGYGEAEALLAQKHPEHFNWLGGSIWRGRIYAASKFGVITQRPVIYHGIFASGYFQSLYGPPPAPGMMLLSSLEYHVLSTLPLFVLSLSFRVLLPVAITSLLLSVGVCVVAGAQADLPRKKCRWWSRPLVALLYCLQPLARGWARYGWQVNVRSTPARARPLEAEGTAGEPRDTLSYWSPASGADRLQFLGRVIARLDAERWKVKPDTGWTAHDLEIIGSPLSRLRLVTMSEELGRGVKVIRFRLCPRWSLQARALWGTALAMSLLLIGALASWLPWIWMLLLAMPGLSWFIEHHQARLHRTMVALLDDVAREHSLVSLAEDEPAPRPDAGTLASGEAG